jgi:hypothetical protein
MKPDDLLYSYCQLRVIALAGWPGYRPGAGFLRIKDPRYLVAHIDCSRRYIFRRALPDTFGKILYLKFFLISLDMRLDFIIFGYKVINHLTVCSDGLQGSAEFNDADFCSKNGEYFRL